MPKLGRVLENRIKDVETEVKRLSRECTRSERWFKNPLLMVVDAALNSTGLNYFTVVVPKTLEFKAFAEKSGIGTFSDMAKLKPDDKRLLKIMNNPRAWNVAIEVSAILARNGRGDKSALRTWAKSASHETWKDDGIGKIRGVGINTFQYLRMQGGADTTMPDKIVKKFIDEVLEESGAEMKTERPEDLIETVEAISKKTGYTQTELCWLAWTFVDKKFMRGFVP